jgi:hypothetical protein
MKVLNLQCAAQHSFEGWFGSEEDFQSQLSRGLVECPMCGSAEVVKLLSAPRLNLGAGRPPEKAAENLPTAAATSSDSVAATLAPTADMQLAWLKMVQHVMANTEDVGKQFAQEARKIHYGESEERAIRGHASPEETEALLDEGISVMPLPLPAALKGTIQ